VVYEHTPASLLAQRLAKELSATLAEIRGRGTKVYDGEAAIALRAIERGARETGKAAGGDPAAYLTLMGRLIQVRTPRASDAAAQKSLIVP
jgi:hypothetical protein